MKKLPLIALGLLIAVQFAVPFKMIQGKENILRNGTEFKFKTRPIDPADPFQGRYVRLAYEDDYIPGNKKQDPDLAYKQPIYALLQTGEDGFAVFTGWSIEKPIGGHYLKTRSLGRKDTWNRETKKERTKAFALTCPSTASTWTKPKRPAPRCWHAKPRATPTVGHPYGFSPEKPLLKTSSPKANHYAI